MKVLDLAQLLHMLQYIGIAFAAVGVAIIITCIISCIRLGLLIKYHGELKLDNEVQYSRKIKITNYKLKNLKLDYSEHAIEYLKNFIAQACVMKFRTFRDSYDLTKVTISQLKNFASEVAIYVHQSIKDDMIDLSMTTFTEEYYDQFIIDATFTMIKDMFDRALNEIEKES